MGARLKAEMLLKLRDQLTGPLRRVPRTLRETGRAARSMANEMRRAGSMSAKVAADQRRLAAASDRNTAALMRQAHAARRLEDRYKRLRDLRLRQGAMVGAAGIGGMYAGRRVLAGATAPVKTAKGWESAFADVKKVADFQSEAEATAYARQLRKMKVSVSLPDRAAIAAEALQSGISKKDFLRFTEFTAKSSVAFDMAAGETGEAFAKIRNNFKLTQKEIELTADAANHLSNNMAAKAHEIIAFSKRSAGAAPGLGQNAIEMEALGASFIAVGTQAEVAARAVNALSNRVHAGSGKQIETAFGYLGLDRKAFSKRLKREGVPALMDLLERASKHSERDFIMKELAGQDFTDDFNKLLNNLNILKEAYGLVADARNYAGSAEAEYAVKAGTTEFKEIETLSRINSLGVTLGESVLPTYKALLDLIGRIADRLNSWAEAHPRLTKWLMLSAFAVGGLLVAGGALLMTAGSMIATIAILRFGLAMLGIRARVGAGMIGLLARGFGKLAGLKPLKWAMLIPKLAWALFITPLKWLAFIPRLAWALFAGRLSWAALITPLKWGARFIPFIGWALLAGTLAWDLLIKPLGWDQYMSIDALKGLWQRAKALLSDIDLTSWVTGNADAAEAVGRHRAALAALVGNAGDAAAKLRELTEVQRQKAGLEAREGIAAAKSARDKTLGKIDSAASDWLWGDFQQGRQWVEQVKAGSMSVDQLAKNLALVARNNTGLWTDANVKDAREMLQILPELERHLSDLQKFEKTLDAVNNFRPDRAIPHEKPIRDLPLPRPKPSVPSVPRPAAGDAGAALAEINEVRAAADALPGAVRSAVQSAEATLSAVNWQHHGHRMMATLAAGVTAGGALVKQAVAAELAKARALLPSSNAKEGPLSRLTDNGAAILRTMGQGVSRAGGRALAAPLEKALAGVAGLPAPALLPQLAAAGAWPAGGTKGAPAAPPPAGPAGMGGMTINVTFNVTGSGNPEADARRMWAEVEKQARRRQTG